MARYYIDESIIVKGEYLDRGFVLDTDTGKVEWTEPIRNGETRVFDINECIYNDGNDTPVSIEDGELIGARILDKKDVIADLQEDAIVNLNGKEHPLVHVAVYMDEEIREELHMQLAPCDPQEFLDEYCRRHFEKYGEEFDVN